MQGTDIRVAARDGGAQPGRIDLFKRGRECFYAGDGVKLQLNTEKLPFPLARHITESTLEHALAARLNYAGACDAQEADGTKSEAERTEARRRILDRPACSPIGHDRDPVASNRLRPTRTAANAHGGACEGPRDRR